MENHIFAALTWEKHERGGLYIFRLPSGLR